MSRHAQPPSDLQGSLDIVDPACEAAFDPMSHDALRAAYRETYYYERGITFAEALEDTGLRLCLKNLAESRHRRLVESHRHPTHAKDPACA